VKTCGKSARGILVTVSRCKPRLEQDQTPEESRPGSSALWGRSLEFHSQGWNQMNDRPRQNSAYRSAHFSTALNLEFTTKTRKRETEYGLEPVRFGFWSLRLGHSMVIGQWDPDSERNASERHRSEACRKHNTNPVALGFHRTGDGPDESKNLFRLAFLASWRFLFRIQGMGLGH
jgi:hypothetical protein